MGISQYIREIGRGKDGARPLRREQAADLFGQVLDGKVTELEIGAFCLAMRIKGETPQEMAGFLDAAQQRLNRLPATDKPVVVIPSYNGARKLPVLTPLLALLLAREGLPVLVHGTATESNRIEASTVLAALDIPAQHAIGSMANGEIAFAPTELLCPGLKRLLDVRRVVGVRNPAHSVAKLINPCVGKSLIVSSYTHPEYALSMAATIEIMQSNALLLRGTEGESVADARRMPRMEGFLAGRLALSQAAESGSLAALPELPGDIDAVSTARYIRRVMAGESPLPPSIAQQVKHIVQLTSRL
ncbi:MAG TPA: DNA-binding protein YbiB [Burkholderiales bacterium]|nr:DNA-binding protein YbiB [Burkholderiales bacterium]